MGPSRRGWSAALFAVCVALGASSGRSRGVGQVAVPRARLFGLVSIIIPPSNEASVDLGPFAAPDEGSRMALIDRAGVLARGTLHDVRESADCGLCGAPSGTAELHLDGTPARPPFPSETRDSHMVVVGPLADGAPDPALALSEVRGRVVESVDLDGDGRGDVALLYDDHACSGPARHLGIGPSACDLMRREVCESQATRGPVAWRPFERVEHAVCVMDGRMGFDFGHH